MYHAVVRRMVRKTYRRLSHGDFDTVLRSFAPEAVFCFAGDHALGGELEGVGRIGVWFDRFRRLFPGIQLAPHTICVSGWPWDTVVATRFTVAAALPTGSQYGNEGMQLLRLRWGRVVEDRLYEDTQALVSALHELAVAGIAEAIAPALSPVIFARGGGDRSVNGSERATKHEGASR